MNNQLTTPTVGVLGLLANITLNDVNEILAVLVGAATLIYMVLKIFKEIRKKGK
ncbi:hypothetical protein [Altibacter sp.]|uniref:hypothetical protein n=1 Tax=Altibacter sp. TaxID=2024823 RepID=UPI0025BDB7B9|nr:hypothetical protein [Altibacter sp.]